MRIIRDPKRLNPCVLVLGMFDGVHRGHQALLMRGDELAQEMVYPLAVCTFQPHPLHVLAPEKEPVMLTTLPEKAAVMQSFGVDGLCVGLCGDLKNGRTVHSLIKALAKFNDIKFFLISPRELAVPDYMRVFMREHQMWFTEVTGLEAVIPQLDVLYMTRIQKERFVDPLEYERNKGIYVLTRRKLERARPDMLVMHPLPRVDEITVDVDDDPRAVYFQQARYGMFARMALLEHLALQPRDEHPAPVEIGTRPICRNPRCITQTEHYLPPLVKRIGGVDCCGFCDAALG